MRHSPISLPLMVGALLAMGCVRIPENIKPVGSFESCQATRKLTHPTTRILTPLVCEPVGCLERRP